MAESIRKRFAFLKMNSSGEDNQFQSRNPAGNLLDCWDVGSQGPMRVGLSGFNTATGLGYQNRDLNDKLPISSWLVVEHPSKSTLPLPQDVALVMSPIEAQRDVLLDWLKQIDCLLFYEQPFIGSLPSLARQMGIAVVCIPNWEWLNPGSGWLNDVDGFVCPNRHTFDLLTGWKAARNAQWKIEHVPAPVDAARFRPKIRERCESFVFINGHGGCTPYFPGWLRHRKGPPRKGLDVVLRAAKMVPEIPILVRSQVKLPPRFPRNVTLLPPVEDNTELFEMGDIAIQPSYFEGTCLQMIETLAAGMPLIATDSAPINELPLLGAIRCEQRAAKVAGNSISIGIPDPKDLARLMEMHFNTAIAGASAAAKTHAEEHHSWSHALAALTRFLNQALDQDASPAL